MNKKTNSVKNSAPADFSWAKDSAFIPPKVIEGAAAYQTHTPSIAGDLKPLLEEFLSTLVATIKASSGIVRIFPPPHGQTPQIISTIGFPEELLEIENNISINCETFGKTATNRGIYASDIGDCKARHGCRYLGCQIKSLIAAPLESHDHSGNQIGFLTLFFDTPQEPSEHVSKTVH